MGGADGEGGGGPQEAAEGAAGGGYGVAVLEEVAAAQAAAAASMANQSDLRRQVRVLQQQVPAPIRQHPGWVRTLGAQAARVWNAQFWGLQCSCLVLSHLALIGVFDSAAGRQAASCKCRQCQRQSSRAVWQRHQRFACCRDPNRAAHRGECSSAGDRGKTCQNYCAVKAGDTETLSLMAAPGCVLYCLPTAFKVHELIAVIVAQSPPRLRRLAVVPFCAWRKLCGGLQSL